MLRHIESVLSVDCHCF